MIARSFILAVCVVVMSPGLSRPQEAQPPDRPPGVSSQPPDRSPGVSSGASIPAAAPASTADRKMYEDIEILRRILDRKLHTLYPSHTCPNTGGMSGIAGMQGGIAGLQGGMGFQGGMGNFQGMGTFQGGMGWSTAGSPMGMANPIVIPIRTLEGVYLKGQGVVYTVTLSSLQLAAKIETAKPVSEWESVRREFRKEKETPKKPDEGKAAGLREVLLKVLAENGHHFSRLGENESLTIVITVHEERHSRTPRKSEEKSAKAESNAETVRAEAIRALSLSGTLSSKAHDLEVLGDLHLKQGRYAEAIKSFLTAVESASGSKQKAALHRKLAQAYLMLEKNEEARSHLDKVIELQKVAVDAKNKPDPAANREATSLPVKMIITVPKKLLDQTGEGKMPFEEFCRRASVETLRFEGSQR